jgi:hypothetical protein
MTVRQPRYSKEEFAQRGDALYESQIRLPASSAATPTQVEEGNHGKIVAITCFERGYANDIETGAFEVADDILPATNRLFERFPFAYAQS